MKTFYTAGTKRIVTSCMGSWQWQQAYRISTYGFRLGKNGKVLWESVSTSGKMSLPQLERLGLTKSLKFGSMHNRQVERKEAIKLIGISRVRSIEKRGYSFK